MDNVIDIHPYDWSAMFMQADHNDKAHILKNGLIKFQGKIYNPTNTVAYKSENEPSTFFAKRLEILDSSKPAI